VAEHYGTLPVDELTTAVLDHYERLWPDIEKLIRTRGTGPADGSGLVLEGSALWPDRVAQLTVPHTAAVWLTADAGVLRARIHRAGSYDDATPLEKRLIDAFLARTLRYQALMLAALGQRGLDSVHVRGDEPVAELVSAVLATVDTQAEVGRSDGGR
jgi:hypothetical protein